MSHERPMAHLPLCDFASLREPPSSPSATWRLCERHPTAPPRETQPPAKGDPLPVAMPLHDRPVSETIAVSVECKVSAGHLPSCSQGSGDQ